MGKLEKLEPVKQEKTEAKKIDGKEVLREFDLNKETIEEVEDIKKELEDLPKRFQEIFKLEQSSLISKYKGYIQALATVNGIGKNDNVYYQDGKLYVLES